MTFFQTWKKLAVSSCKHGSGGIVFHLNKFKGNLFKWKTICSRSGCPWSREEVRVQWLWKIRLNTAIRDILPIWNPQCMKVCRPLSWWRNRRCSRVPLWIRGSAGLWTANSPEPPSPPPIRPPCTIAIVAEFSGKVKRVFRRTGLRAGYGWMNMGRRGAVNCADSICPQTRDCNFHRSTTMSAPGREAGTELPPVLRTSQFKSRVSPVQSWVCRYSSLNIRTVDALIQCSCYRRELKKELGLVEGRGTGIPKAEKKKAYPFSPSVKLIL